MGLTDALMGLTVRSNECDIWRHLKIEGNPRFFHPPMDHNQRKTCFQARAIFKGKSFIFRQSPYDFSDVSLI
jgi:hypothetical protein